MVDRTNAGLVATCRVNRRTGATIIERTFPETQVKTAALWEEKPVPGRSTASTCFRCLPRLCTTGRIADVLKDLGIEEEVEDIPVREPIKSPSKPQPVAR